MALTGRRDSGGGGGAVSASRCPSGAGGRAAPQRVTDVYQFGFDSVITTRGWGIGYDILHLRRVLVVEVGDYVVKFCRVQCDVRQSKLAF
jgi:hypothetical protein